MEMVSLTAFSLILRSNSDDCLEVRFFQVSFWDWCFTWIIVHLNYHKIVTQLSQDLSLAWIRVYISVGPMVPIRRSGAHRWMGSVNHKPLLF